MYLLVPSSFPSARDYESGERGLGLTAMVKDTAWSAAKAGIAKKTVFDPVGPIACCSRPRPSKTWTHSSWVCLVRSVHHSAAAHAGARANCKHSFSLHHCKSRNPTGSHTANNRNNRQFADCWGQYRCRRRHRGRFAVVVVVDPRAIEARQGNGKKTRYRGGISKKEKRSRIRPMVSDDQSRRWKQGSESVNQLAKKPSIGTSSVFPRQTRGYQPQSVISSIPS